MVDDNKAAVLRLLEAMDRGDLSILDELCARDLQVHFMNSELTIEDVRTAATGFNAAFPDLRHTIEELTTSGDRVFLRAIDRATHCGIYHGVSATGRRVEFETSATYRIENG